MVADEVAMIRNGEIVFCDELDSVKQSHLRVTLWFDEPRNTAPQIRGAFCWEGNSREWTCMYSGNPSALEVASALCGSTIVQRDWLTLDEIFLARTDEVRSHS